jgi:hypothetical protein
MEEYYLIDILLSYAYTFLKWFSLVVFFQDSAFILFCYKI